MPTTFFYSRAAAVAVFLATALSSWAGTALSLPEALSTAVHRSRQIDAQDAVVASARELAVSASQLPDPVLKLGVDNLPVNGEDRFSLTNDFMTMRRVGVMQEIPRADKRLLRAERFERDAQRALAERQMAVATVQRNTAMAWSDRYYALAMRELVQRQVQETQLQVPAAQALFAAGRGSQVDVFAARSALVLMEDRLSQIDRQARAAALALERWVGDAAQRQPDGPPPWQSTPLERVLSPEHIRNHPDMQVLAVQVETSRTEARLAQANTQADWTVEANYSQRGPAYANMISFGVSIPLQLDQRNRQNREISAKLALVTEAQARFDDMLRNHETEVRTLLNDWQSGKERLARFAESFIPIAQQRSQAALAGYRTGKTDLAAALSARRDEIDTMMQALTLEQETARQWAQLQFLTPNVSTASSSQEQP